MSSSLRQLFGGSGTGKRPRSGTTSTVESSAPADTGSGSAAAAAAAASSSQQPRSFAAVASGAGSKRSGPAPPAFPRPQLQRGPAVIEHADYKSMERPAPDTPAPNVLYLDILASTLTPEELLDIAFPVLGNLVLGFLMFAAQKTISLIFASDEAAAHYVDKQLGATGLTLYRAPPKKVNLLKLTLQGVPFWALDALKTDLTQALHPVGDLVFLAPMVHGKWWSDQWHATIARPAGSQDLPPELITVCGQQVIVDVPGQRRYCRHCAASTHVKPSCRQGQRLKQRLNQQVRDLAAVTAAQQQQQPNTTTTIDTTTSRSSNANT